MTAITETGRSRTAPPAKGRKPKLRHDGVCEIAIGKICPSPENDQLYRPVDPKDPAIRDLASSIATHGIREPLVVTADGWILSGHRRFAAARLAKLKSVPCRVEPINRSDYTTDKYLVVLREFNRQREKTFAEKLREEMLDINPRRAYKALREHRKQQSLVADQPIEIVGQAKRCRISNAKQPFIDAISRVLKQRRSFWPLSDRAIHYALLNDPPLKHASKPDSIYKNDARSYDSLTELLTRARLQGLIPFDAIADETRPVECRGGYGNTREFIRSELSGFMWGYYRDLLQSQPNHIELIGEKNTVARMLREVADEYCMPLTIGRGYCSLAPRRDMANRYWKSGKEKLVVIIVSDFDPDGEEIAHSFARSMRDDFGIWNIHPVKAALTAEQVDEHMLEPQMVAKETSSNYKKFVEKYGENVYELEALDPEDLQEIVRTTIDSVIDSAMFNAEVEQEEQDAANLEAIRKTCQEALKGIDAEPTD